MFDFLKQKNKKEYDCCRYLQGGITFMPDFIATCCSNKKGVIFCPEYKGKNIDWKQIERQRQSVLNSCKKGILPENCKGCIDLETKVWEEKPLINEIYLNYWDHCNCGCVYCVLSPHGEFLKREKKPSKYYSVYEHLNKLYRQKKISKNVHVELVGGDLTVLDEAEDIINLCLNFGVGRMSFHTSGIFYSEGIERALKEAPCVDIDFSLDCGSRELYKKIKRIDAFDNVVQNIKKYLNCSPKAPEAIIAKYIILDGLNDSVEEIDKWINLIYEMGIKNSKIDINFKRFFPEWHHYDPNVPKHYYDIYNHFEKRTKELGIKTHYWEFSKRVFEQGRTPDGY